MPHKNMHTFRAMNTMCSTLGLSNASHREVEAWMAYVEQKASRFLPNSEITRINQSDAPLHIVSALIYHLMREAEVYYRETDGLFCHYLGKQLSSLGYAESFERMRDKLPAGNENSLLYRSSQAAQHKQIYCFKNGKAYTPITIDAGNWIDLGGIAKGWSVQKMADWLQKEERREGLLNAGGDIVAWSDEATGLPWQIQILEPRDEKREVARLTLHAGTVGIATSSWEKRRWRQSNGSVSHHIIDPRTQKSASSDIWQATVLLPDLTAAEVYAKCLLILGTEQGPPWLRQRKPEAAYVLVKNDGSIEANRNIENYCVAYEVKQHVECI